MPIVRRHRHPDLDPCRYCGTEKPTMFNSQPPMFGEESEEDDKYEYYVSCSKCGLRSPRQVSKQEAATWWHLLSFRL